MYSFKILNKKKFLPHFTNAFINNLCTYLLPVLLAWFITPPFTTNKFLLLTVSFILLKAVDFISEYIWMIYTHTFFSDYVNILQVKYFERIYNMPLHKLNESHSGYLKKQVDIITSESNSFLGFVLDVVNGSIISVTIFLITTYFQSLTLFFISIGVLIIIVIINIWFSKKTIPYQKKYNDVNSKYNSSFVDLLQNIKTLKKLDSERYGSNRITSEYKPVRKDYINILKMIEYRFLSVGFIVFVMFFIIIVNLFFKMKAGVNVVPALVLYITMFRQISNELRRLSRVFESYSKLQAADTQVEEILGNQTIKKTVKKWDRLIIKDLSFHYKDNKNTSINIPEFDLKRFDKVSIVGKSGQGKTTFLNILCGYLGMENGEYLIDGKKSDKVLNLAYVSQEVELLNVSIRENICLDKNISDEKIMEFFAAAGMKNWVEKLPDGLDTVVGERGLKLSAGQKQRLNLIRGIILDKDVYILDEPTSNLDEATEELIVQLIESYLKEKTLLVVTHRPKVKEICNKHFIFEHHTMKQL